MPIKTFNIAMDDDLLKKIDSAAKSELSSRSEYFRRLALNDLDKRLRWQELTKAGKKQPAPAEFDSHHEPINLSLRSILCQLQRFHCK